MIEEVSAAFDRKDYRNAAQLLKDLVKQEPQNPWVQLYVGRLHKVTGKLEAAETAYLMLLRNTTIPKIMTAARQGMQRLAEMEKETKRQALAESKASPDAEEQGVLVLEPIADDAKTAAAQKFARIMQLDPYTARLHLPSRSWRLYRAGSVGELRYYGQQLDEAEIPSFWASIADIKKINVFRVNYFESEAKQPTVFCQNEHDQQGSLAFNWSEVGARVEGLLPIFEEVVDMDWQRKLQRKTKTLDYAHFCDLHLPARRSILRLCDHNYQFQNGVVLSQTKHAQAQPISQQTTRTNWNSLLTFVNQKLPQTRIWSDFTAFAETGVEQVQLLQSFNSHIDLLRREDTPWDCAFHLYSGLVFLRHANS